MSGAKEWFDAAGALLDKVASTQLDAVEEASRYCADAIGGGGLVHLFGTGHSHIPVEEMFPRYGSYPGFHPIVELSMTFHTQVVGANGQRQAMFIERVPGLAHAILANFNFALPDAFMVFSVSGINAVPVEMAMGARERGLKVIAVTSVTQSLQTPTTHISRTRLLDHADVVLDLCTPSGDALVTVDDLEGPVGPGSTFVAVALVNALKTRTAQLLVERDAPPTVITSASVSGKHASARSFDDAYAEHARRVQRVLRCD